MKEKRDCSLALFPKFINGFLAQSSPHIKSIAHDSIGTTSILFTLIQN